MTYNDIIKYALDERNKIDAIVADIVRLNGKGYLFRIGEPAVIVEPKGKLFQVQNAENIFSQE
ncbi:MAG: hypothetical protein L7F77_08560 [Candidatus Magnetominusculus sp. LBB02]|nr:hypothetical protein [Candidatus Magnetominusculus sp. LBB02]